MKQGSTDDPFADDEEEDEFLDDPDEDERQSTMEEPAMEQSRESAKRDEMGSARPTTQRRSLPYIHSRDGVKDGRTQRPVFLRDHVENGIGELVAKMETELGEDVYKTDVTEASMVVAQEHPELVLEKLEEWGYGWD